MDFWDIEKQVTRGHAYFAERTIRTIKEAMLRRIAAGAGRRGQWHLMLADILSQINGRKHATTQVAPNLAYSDPEMAEIALRNIERRAKHKVTRPEIKVGDQGLLQGQRDSLERKGTQGCLRRERGDGGEVWLGGVAGKGGAGISEKSPKTQLPNRGGWRCNPASGGYREAPGSHLLFDSTCTSLRRLRQLRLPLTDELLLVVWGCSASPRHLWPSNFPAPVPHDVALEPAQGKLSPLCARGRGAKSRADLAHLFQDFLRVLGILELARKASGFHERAVQLLIEELDAAALVRALGLKQRILARPLVGRQLRTRRARSSVAADGAEACCYL